MAAVSWIPTALLASHHLAGCSTDKSDNSVIFGPAATTWFGILQRHVVLKNANATILARVAVDQGLFAPTFVGVFLSSMAILEGSSPQEKLKSTYSTALTSNYMLWPFVQLVK